MGRTPRGEMPVVLGEKAPEEREDGNPKSRNPREFWDSGGEVGSPQKKSRWKSSPALMKKHRPIL